MIQGPPSDRVARRRGSVPEVIADGVTGFIGESDKDLAALCERVHELDREACRLEAVRRFSSGAMADWYEATYRSLQGRGEQRPWSASPWSDGRTADGRTTGLIGDR
jgi:glycosyltransferase involved in cell wall biosynthesis